MPRSQCVRTAPSNVDAQPSDSMSCQRPNSDMCSSTSVSRQRPSASFGPSEPFRLTSTSGSPGLQAYVLEPVPAMQSFPHRRVHLRLSLQPASTRLHVTSAHSLLPATKHRHITSGRSLPPASPTPTRSPRTQSPASDQAPTRHLWTQSPARVTHADTKPSGSVSCQRPSTDTSPLDSFSRPRHPKSGTSTGKTTICSTTRCNFDLGLGT